MINEIANIYSPSGLETASIDFLSRNIRKNFDTIIQDNIGNLILHKEGTGKKVVLECGMDTKGVMVVSENDGKIHFATVGGTKPSSLIDKKLVFSSGAWAIARYDGEKPEDANISDIYAKIDENDTFVGDFGVLSPDFCSNKKEFLACNLSDKAGLMAVFSALCEPFTSDIDLVVVFSAQKKLGGRGIRSYFSEASDPDLIISVNSCPIAEGIKADNGCVIVAKDKNCVCDPITRKAVEAISKNANIAFQTSVTNENLYIQSFFVSGKTSPLIALAAPISHWGKDFEAMSIDDFNSLTQLIKELLNKVGGVIK